MKTCCYILFLLTVPLAFGQGKTKTISLEGLKQSTLVIEGKTNINTFTCRFDTEYLNSCQDIKVWENGNTIYFKDAILVLKTDGFDCGSRLINRDFQRLLKTEDYPQISLELIKASCGTQQTVATVAIKIAGTKKAYTVAVVHKDDAHYAGTLMLKLSDYGISQPKKLLGMIQVKDELAIHFDLKATYLIPENLVKN